MELLDEHGRVFGVVNIIDLLVVLFVVAVGVAGIALVVGDTGDTGDMSDTDEDRVTQTVTVDLGTHPPEGAALVKPGNVTFGGSNATLTDVYRTPSESGVRVVAALRVEGQMAEGVFTVGGTPVRYGSMLQVTTPSYQYSGSVISIGEDGPISTTPVTATLTANVSTAVADAVEAGDEYRLAGQTVATIQNVTREATNGERVRLAVRVEFVARETTSGPVYGGEPIRLGRQLTIATDRYEFVGEVTEVEQ